MKLLEHLKRNWKTTAAGVGTLIAAAPKLADPAAATQPETITLVLTALGLIFASDSRIKDK